MLGNFICDNQIFHSRLKPFKNYFSYNICSILLDINKTKPIKKLKLLSINKFNIFSVNFKEYGDYSGDLYNFISNLLKKKFKTKKKYDIFLLTSPKFIGYIFNPISIYFIVLKKKLKFIVYEVRNTHGEKHMYFKKISNEKKITHTINKKMYVSPFLKMNLKYFFKISVTKKNILILIDAYKNNELLKTGMILSKKQLNDKNLLKLAVKRMFYAQKIIVLIHYQAIKILLKKAKFNFKDQTNKNTYSFS